MRLLRLWGPITFSVDLRLRWILKQSCSPRQELSNDMLHATWTQGSRVDSRLLVVASQTANLTPGLSFGHNLCFRCSNGSCESILDIYVWITFQWYKEVLKPLSFGLWNRALKIRESTRTPNSQSGSSLESVRVYYLTFSYTPRSMRHDSRASFLARNLATPCLGREPKARVATDQLMWQN